MSAKVAVLAGGVGAARFIEGLARVLPQRDITIIGNTADDIELHGLAISPDLDTVMYTLAGLNDPERGWGLKDETFHCLEALGAYSDQTWFRLGDRDLATHIQRTAKLRDGATLSEVTAELCRAHGVEANLLPMSNDRVRTWVETDSGWIDFQTYFVKRQAGDAVSGIAIRGAAESSAGPGVIEAIVEADLVIVAPSNPLISIGPILGVPGIREALASRQGPVVAVSPLVGGRALKGPTVAMMQGVGLEPSAAQVAKLYEDFASIFVLDHADRGRTPEIEALGLEALVTQTVMKTLADKEALAQACLVAGSVVEQ